MKKSILITGVSGVGKSAVCGKLNELGYKSYDMDELPGLFTMIDGNTGKPMVGQDNSNLGQVMAMEWICDKNLLESIILSDSDQIVFYCGNAENIDEIIPLFDKTILMKASAEEICKRLSNRSGNDFGKTKEIQDWIIKSKDSWESRIEDKGAIVVDASESLDEISAEIIDIAMQAV